MKWRAFCFWPLPDQTGITRAPRDVSLMPLGRNSCFVDGRIQVRSQLAKSRHSLKICPQGFSAQLWYGRDAVFGSTLHRSSGWTSCSQDDLAAWEGPEMNTPKRMGITETQAQISEYLSLHCRLDGIRTPDMCSLRTQDRSSSRVYVSHDEQFGDLCIGPARAWRMEIHYCPTCDNLPSGYGCIHMSKTDLNLPSVRAASRPFGREHPQHREQTSNSVSRLCPAAEPRKRR